MARNRHPEATVERILAEAARLFLQKGYEKTSMQDIMEGTGLSKGAIYHHFSSKEDILLRIGERMGEENAAALQRVMDAPGLNGAQKLKEVFRTALQGERQAQMLRMIPFLIDNPRFLAIPCRRSLHWSLRPTSPPSSRKACATARCASSARAKWPKR